MKRAILFTIVLILSWTSLCLAQGPIDGYMKGKGHIDAAFTYSSEFFDTYLFGKERQSISNQTRTISLFATGGLNDNLDFVLSVPYIWTDSLNRNFQDAILALKFLNGTQETEHGSWSLVTAVGLTFPVANYRTDTERPIGQKAIAFQPRLLAQYQDQSGFFFMAQSGLDFRVAPTDKIGFPLIVRGGYAGAKLYADLWFDLFKTINPGVDTGIQAGEGSDWYKVGATLYKPVGRHLGLFISGAVYLGGRNIGLAQRVNVGFVLRK